MSLREEQCKKVCRILDNVLANRPTERDSLIVDTRKAFKALAESKRGKWIKISPANIYECSECGKNVMTNDICAYDFCHGCGAEMEVTT